MKNFYESTTIDTSSMLTVSITVQPIHYEQNKMFCNILLNDVELYNGIPGGRFTVTFFADLLSPLDFKFIVSGKQPHDTCELGDVALMIENISVNNHDISLHFENHATYISNNQKIPACRYMGFNGTQTFVIDKPFYHWLHLVNPWGWIA